MKLKQHLLIVLMIILSSLGTYAQVAVPFTQRLAGGSIRIKGDIVFVGNNITNRAPANSPSDANNPYNGTANNNGLNFEYIDVDGDPSTFSSSTADLNISTSCKRIVYAGLYWTATYPFERSGPNGDGTSSNYTGSPRNNSWNQVKFKVPGGAYVDLVADNAADPPGDEDSIIFDGFNPANPSGSFYAAPYVCYKNVTSLVQALANANGTYAVANQRAARGIRPDGISSGWSLVIIYESPTLPSKYISTFDGYANIFSGINAANAVDFDVNGFQTLPAPLPVRARIGVSSLEGDVSLTNDRFRIRANSVGGFTTLSNAVNPADNFFNGSISNNGAILTNRNPNSTNTLGYDLDIVNVNNPGNAVIPNGETGATLRVTTNGDAYGTYLATFDVEIIEPVISLTKVVQDIAGNDIGNAEVQLCQDLVYVIGFQNIGNDDAQNFTIRDVLPVNVTFDQLTTAGALPAGVTIQSYNAATREVVFAINNSLVNQNDPRVEIRLRVRVVCSCLEMDDACSNLIQNQAYATYQGVLNTSQITDDPSLSAFLACNLGDPSPSNFLVNLDNCNFTRTEVLCGPSIVLTAANGYESYVWSGPGTITPVPGTNNQSVTVTQPGTYTVNNNINTSPCKSIVETINVITYGAGVTNPVIPYADQVVICPNNGNQLPLIFLCGAGDSQLIQTNITGATAIEWYQLSGTCTPLPAVNCPNENTSCVWNLLNTGPNFTVTVAGEYRVIVRFPGGCDRTFYFNAYENVLNPTYVSRDIICNTAGQITVNNVPGGYEYSLSPSGPWQTSNVFTINTPGTYTVYIRQVGVTGGCVFTIPNIGIRARNFTATFTLTQPLCTGDRGSINIAANDGEPQYTFTILQGATVVTSAGPIVANNYVFNNLNPGNYTYQVTTQDGCLATGNFTINTPPTLTVTAALTVPLTCTDGEITVYPVGGTAPYNYVITGAVTVTQSSPVIVAPVAGTYNIQVVDFNNCSATTSIVVNQVQPPVFTIADTDILCASSGNSGTITINVTNANGNTLLYSIDNGATFVSSNVFTNLAPGTYNVVVQYTYGGQACTTTPQTVVITAPPALTATATITQPYTCVQPAIVTVTASGGTPGYNYSIDGVNFQAGNTFTITAPGTYTITIRDTNGCTITRTVVIPPVVGPSDLYVKDQVRVTCPSLTGSLNIDFVPGFGGVPPRRFRIVAPASQATGYVASGNFLNLPPDVYTFEIIDGNGCTYQETFVLDPVVPTVITPQVTNNVRCFGTATGSGQFVISNIPNGTDYNYTVTNSGGTTITSASGTTPASGSTNITVNLPNLPASTYTISVYNDYNECTNTASFTITQPSSALTASLTSTPITCTTNGTVTVNASGGWGGYVYTITPNVGVTQSGSTFSNITAGTYTLTTTDSGGCQVTNSITFTNAPALSATISATSDFCYDTTNAATIVVTPSGGTPPFTYTINGTPNSPNTSNTFGPLTPGTYNIVVTDSFGCTFALPSQTINPQLTLSTNLTKDLDCTASPNAVITGTVSGGYPGYTYTVNATGPFPVPGSGIFTYSTATAGTYNFVVTDSRGCVTATSSVTIAPLSLPQITSVTQTQQILCNGDSTAAINVVINTSVGTAPYVINVFNNTTGTNYGTQTSGLPAGNYTITLTDAKSCTDTETIIITQPAPLNFTAVVNPMTCTAGGTALGSICVNGLTGGTAPYVYSLTDLTGGTGTQTFSTPLPVNHCFINIDFGIYNLSVTDANGCTLVRTNLVMSSPPSDLDIQISSSIASCAAGGTAVVTVVPIVAGGPYVFGILTQNTPPYAIPLLPADPGFPLQHTFTGLTPGALYTFVVYDTTTGCYYFEQATATVPTNSTMTINPLTPNNVTCIGAADGSVTFSVTGIGVGATSVSYIIYNASTNVATGISGVIPAPFVFPVTAGPLAPGSYYIQLVENGGVNSGCGITSTPFTISQSSTPLAVTATATNDNCNTNAGLITAVGTGGTAPYRYSFVLSPLGPGPFGALGVNTANVESGTYNVYIQDANGCVRSTTVTVNLDPTPVIAATLANACVVQGTYSINVTLTSPGVGPYTLSLDGGAFVTHTLPYTFTGLSSGTHTVQVRDFNGCGNTVSVTILEPLVASAVFTTQPTCNNPNGQITVTATGGSGNYSYSISPNAGITLAGNVFSNVQPGSYTVNVTDTTTGCTTTAPVNLVAPDPVTFTIASTPVVCNGDSNGTITVTLSAGNNNPAYTYQITAGPSTTGPQTSNVFTGLATGTYTILVTSGRGCTATQNVTVGTPTPVVASGSATPFTCAADNSVNTSTVTINGAGGTPTYTYSIDGTNYFTTNTFAIVDNGAVQNITIYVRDVNGCIDSDMIVINPLPTLVSATIAQDIAITCTNPEQVTVTVVGGSGNFNYELIPASGTATPQPQASNVFIITSTGTYVIRVNDLTTGCYIMTIPYEIAPYDTIQVDATATNAVTCFGGTDGSIAINVTGYTGAYTYNVLNSSNTVVLAGAGNTSTNPMTIAGLGAGNYTVQITETNSPFCTEVSGIVSIQGPNAALAVTAVISAPLTCDPNTAQITATATDGWGTYEYELVGPVNAAFSSNNVFSNLPAGNYTINVRDLEGCLASTSVTITAPLPINTTVTPSTTLLACFGDTNASITIAYPTGGQGSNYSYVFNTIAPVASSSGPIAMPLGGATITDLGAGTYNVTITDGFNCTFTSANIVINQPTEVNASLVLTNSPSCDNPTVLTLTANGGTPPYTYSADGVTYSVATFNPSVTISIPAGTTGVFNYFVRDTNGCVSVVSNDIQIDPIPAMTLSTLTHVDILCGGSATGSITAVAQGGLGNYTYSLVDAGGNPITIPGVTQPSPGVFNNLPAGTYYIHVVSTNAFGSCLFTSGPVTITEPPVFVVSYSQQDVKCNGASDGILTISTTGGTGIIKYAISPNLDQFITITTPASYDVTGLTAGSYTIIVQDQNGCYDQYNFTINEPTILGASIANIQPEICAEDDAGSFDIVNIIGGTAPYTVSYNVIYSGTTTVVNGPVVNLPLGQNSYSFTNLNGGQYEAIVTDANGCTYSTELIIDPGVLFDPQALVTFPCVNNLPAVEVEVLNMSNAPSNAFTPLADYLFSLDDPTMATGQNSNIFTSANYPNLLVPGSHIIYVTNANGCPHQTLPFTILASDVDPLTLILQQGGLNEIEAISTGGSGGNTYTFNGNNNGSDNTYVYDQTGPYTVTVTDNSGCSVTVTQPFTFIPIYIPDVFTPDGDGNNDEWMPQNTSIYPNLKTKIYDRYGRVVAELNEGQGWNGKYHGNELPTGDYWYVLKVDGNDGQEFVGHFTLYR